VKEGCPANSFFLKQAIQERDFAHLPKNRAGQWNINYDNHGVFTASQYKKAPR